MNDLQVLPEKTKQSWLNAHDPNTGDMNLERLNDIAGTQEEVGEHLYHYKGYLGDFTYDDREFRIASHDIVIPAESRNEKNHPYSCPVVQYIGGETDGRKIHIPEGVSHGEFMFYGNEDLTSAPKIPDSMLDMHMMFAGCASITNAKIRIPEGVETTAGMFFNCEHLTDGPSVIPGNVSDMSAMFSGCTSLKNTPSIQEGVIAMDSAFSDCHSLTKKPVLPKSAEFVSDATYNCYGIDKTASLDRQKSENLRMMRAKVERDRNSEEKSFMGKLGDVAGTIVQVGVMNYAGANMLEAMMIVHTLHQQKKLEKGLTGVMGLIAKTDMDHQHPFSGYMYNFMRQEHQARAEHAENKYQSVLKTYAGDAGVMNSLNSEDAFASGQIAAKKGSFKKIAASFNVYQEPDVEKSSEELSSILAGKQYASVYPCQAAFTKELDHIRAELEKNAGPAGIVSRETIHRTNEQVVSLFRQQGAFYQGALNGSGNDRESVTGAQILNNQVMCAGLEKLADMENDYHFLQPHYIKDIQEAVQNTSYKDYMHVSNSMTDEEKKAATRAREAFDGFAEAADAHSRQSASEDTLNRRFFTDGWDDNLNKYRRMARNEAKRNENRYAREDAQEAHHERASSYKTRVPDIQPKFSDSACADSYEQGVEDAAEKHMFVKSPSPKSEEGRDYYRFIHDLEQMQYESDSQITDIRHTKKTDPAYEQTEGMTANRLRDAVHKLSAYFQGAESVQYDDPNAQKLHTIGVHNMEQTKFTAVLGEVKSYQKQYNLFSSRQLHDFLHQIDQTDFGKSGQGEQFRQFVQDELDKGAVQKQDRREAVIDIPSSDAGQQNDGAEFE